jgi:hypothetical protein
MYTYRQRIYENIKAKVNGEIIVKIKKKIKKKKI